MSSAVDQSVTRFLQHRCQITSSSCQESSIPPLKFRFCKTSSSQVASQTRGDHGFAVVIAGSPRLYRPGQVYTVTLEGVREDEGIKVKFIDFMIVAESNLPSTEVSGLGTFQLMPGDAMTKFSHRCSHAVEATSALNKEEVSVVWTAPPVGSGCIMLKAMVVERNDFWFMDDGALTYHICEDDSPMATPPVVEPCTACDEAKYEVLSQHRSYNSNLKSPIFFKQGDL